MMMMKTPGHKNSHGRLVSRRRGTALISEPSETSGGWMPKPRKLERGLGQDAGADQQRHVDDDRRRPSSAGCA